MVLRKWDFYGFLFSSDIGIGLYLKKGERDRPLLYARALQRRQYLPSNGFPRLGWCLPHWDDVSEAGDDDRLISAS